MDKHGRYVSLVTFSRLTMSVVTCLSTCSFVGSNSGEFVAHVHAVLEM